MLVASEVQRRMYAHGNNEVGNTERSRPAMGLLALDGFAGRRAEVQEQDMAPLDRPLDSPNERDAAVRRVGGKRSHIELTVVQRDGKSLIAELGGMVDQLGRRIRNVVDRIVGGVRVQFNLQHVTTLLKILAAVRLVDWLGYRPGGIAAAPKAFEIQDRKSTRLNSSH